MLELKNHVFFAGFNWEKLIRKEMKPPIKICEMKDTMKCKQSNKEMKKAKIEEKFTDEDYTDFNMRENRFSNITFVASAKVS